MPALGCLKASLLLFYKRIFYAGTHRFLRWSLLATLALTVAWTIAFCFTFLLICHRKFDAYWTTLVDEKKYCLDTVMIHNVYGVTDVVLDLIVILLPIPMVSIPWWTRSCRVGNADSSCSSSGPCRCRGRGSLASWACLCSELCK